MRSSLLLITTTTPHRARGNTRSQCDDHSITTSQLPEPVASTSSVDSVCPPHQRIQDAFPVPRCIQRQYRSSTQSYCLILALSRSPRRLHVFFVGFYAINRKNLPHQSNDRDGRGHTTKGDRDSSKTHWYRLTHKEQWQQGLVAFRHLGT